MFSKVTTYISTSFQFTHTVTFALDGVVTGKIYSFQFRALNSKGFSEYSEPVAIAAIAPPAKASTPSVDYTLSTKDQLFIRWALTADGVVPGGLITGYKLYADDGLGGAFTMI